MNDKNPSYVFSVAVYAASFLRVVLLLLLVLLGDDVVQEAEVVLGEHVVHRLPHGDQSEDLKTEQREVGQVWRV